jgi:ABC-2 type transport system ATP-binding protein
MPEAINITDLNKTYDNGTEALHDVSLHIEQGAFFGLLGPNGAGKSTLIEIITGLVNKSAGQVMVNGDDLDRNPAIVRTHVGVVPQEFNFHMFENVYDIILHQAGYYGIPLGKARENTEKYLKELDLWDKRYQQARMLSGGMKRRLMIARALVHEPDTLILDEPTAGVDIEIRRSMWSFVKKLNEEKGKTIILTTHYLEEAEALCKELAIIREGQIIERGDIKQLLSHLDTETVLLDLSEALSEEQQAQVREIAAVDLVDTTTLRASFSKQEMSMTDLLVRLHHEGVNVEGMRNQTNRLEELFVQLVNTREV